MVYEYAIDPKLVATCSDRIRGQLITKSFGIGTPRIFSACPKKGTWRKMVVKAFAEMNKNEKPTDEKQQAKLQFEESQNLTALTQYLIDSSIKRPDTNWNPELNWLENVLPLHEKVPFRGLLSSEPSTDCTEIIELDNFESGDHPSWLVDEQIDVPSNPVEMAKRLEPLLRMAKHVVFIEPYFDMNRSDFISTFREFFKTLSTSYWQMSEITVEIHGARDKGKPHGIDHYKEYCQKNFAKIIPSGLQVKFIRWLEIPGNEELHNRYLLTNLGGIKVDPGFDKRLSKGAETEFILLKKEIYSKRWDQYVKGKAFKLAEEPFLVSGTKS